MRLHFKERVHWGTITWSEMGKQNIQARKVYFGLKRPHKSCQWGRSGARREANALRNLCQGTPYGTVFYNTKSDIHHEGSR